MEFNHNQSGNPQVNYMQDGVQKSAPEDQVIQMLNSIARQDPQRALLHYRSLCDNNPQAQNLLQAFYQTLLNQFMFEELLEVTNQRLRVFPNCMLSFSSRIDALEQMFRNQEVIETLTQVASLNPNDPISTNKLGIFYKSAGDSDKARQHFQDAISRNPAFAPPYWHNSELSLDPEADLYSVRKAIASGQVANEGDHYLHFAAYRLAEKMGDFEQAFEHLQIANGMKRRLLNYDVEAELNIDESAKSVFTPDYLRSISCNSESTICPIFILGMPRSGTTLVEQIIASHSHVSGGDEYTALANAIMRTQQQSQFQGNVEQWLATRTDSDWRRIGHLYEHNTRFIRNGKNVFTDKNQFNHRSVGIIKAALPNAKILIVERNPMDVAFGCYRQLFGGQGAKFSYQYDEIAKTYVSYIGLLDHWEACTDGLIKRIKYEDLVQQPEENIKQILSFCGLEFEQQCVDFHQNKRTVKTLSSSQVRRPIFTHGINRWQQYQAWLVPLINEMEKAGIQQD